MVGDAGNLRSPEIGHPCQRGTIDKACIVNIQANSNIYTYKRILGKTR